MNKKNKKNIVIFNVIALSLILILGGWLLVQKINPSKDSDKYAKSYLMISDFEKLIDFDYFTQYCEIEEDAIYLTVQGDFDTTTISKLCLAASTRLNELKETKNNVTQTKVKIEVYEKNASDFRNQKEGYIGSVDYTVGQRSFTFHTIESLPHIEKANGLMEYELTGFSDNKVSIEMDCSKLSLSEKVAQLKTFYEVFKNLNPSIKDELVIVLNDNNVIYTYDNNNDKQILITRDITF